MKNFTYDVVLLINSIRDRPCLWDKTIEPYKDKTERLSAWDEVFTILEPNYGHMTNERKKNLRDTVVGKWINLRDAFQKSLKRMRDGGNRKYVFYNEMCFLMKVLKYDEDNSCEVIPIDSESPIKNEDSRNEETVVFQNESRWSDEKKRSYEAASSGSESPEYETFLPKKKKPVRDEPEVNFLNIEEVNDPRLMNEDEAFFASLLPTVVRYNEDERLEFRIDVLAVMKKIKDKRRDH